MSTRHTPGPWAVADVGEVVVCATGRTLCDVYSSPTTGDEQADADARLIASAPTMLAVCEGLAAWWMKDGISGNSTLDELASQARTVLRDLEGTKK